MFTFWAVRAPLLAALLILATACSREQQDWRSAESADSREAYARFIEQHGGSELANQARLRIAQLDEERAWGQANGIASIDAYRKFLAHFPNGKWAETARIRIEGFSLGSLPRTQGAAAAPVAARVGVNALQVATGVGAASAAAPPPAPPAAAGAAGVVAAASAAEEGAAAQPAPQAQETRAVMLTRASAEGYGVQLGAFGSEASADREWQRLQGRFSPQLAGLAPRIVVAQTGDGQLYRLQAPASGEAQARALCDVLKEQSQACVPVIPR
jgi:cell division septation protein DedD